MYVTLMWIFTGVFLIINYYLRRTYKDTICTLNFYKLHNNVYVTKIFVTFCSGELDNLGGGTYSYFAQVISFETDCFGAWEHARICEYVAPQLLTAAVLYFC